MNDAKTQERVRKNLEDLIRHSDLDYTSVSLMLNKNRAYIQQFIKRGTPRVLSESDRKTLAAYFGVSELELGAPISAESNRPRHYPHPIRIIPHIMNDAKIDIALSHNVLGHCGSAKTKALRHLIIEDDTMSPFLNKGDVIIINTDICAVDKDGLYIWLQEGKAFVRRVIFNTLNSKFIIRCDNPDFSDIDRESHLNCVPPVAGRVVWISKQV